MKSLTSLWIKQQEIRDGIKERVRGALNNENGQGMVEYGLILALVAIVVIGALALLGDNLNLKFGEINAEIGPGTE